MLKHCEGNDRVVIYCKKENVMKPLPANRNIRVDVDVLAKLNQYFGESRIKVVEKAIENGQ